uniref:DUF1618 domain-containing protein n=1 Tax=Oryza punctata TaxID=4537 RepID=A0A0E0KPR1_ORYPU
MDVKPSMLLRFSLHNHKFDMVPCHPDCTSDNVYGYNTVSELGGKLCYTHTATATTFRLWMLDGDMAWPEWCLRCCIDVVGDVRCISPLVAGGGQILLSVDEEFAAGAAHRKAGHSKNGCSGSLSLLLHTA